MHNTIVIAARARGTDGRRQTAKSMMWNPPDRKDQVEPNIPDE